MVNVENTIFHLTPRVKNREKIELPGYAHPVGPINIPKADATYVQAVLDEHPGRILTEGFKTIHVAYLIPKAGQFYSRAVPIESQLIFALSDKAIQSVDEPLTTKQIRESMARLAKEYQGRTPELSVRPATRKETKEYRKTKGLTRPEDQITTNVRSALLASGILRETRKRPGPIVALMGADHASDVHHFLEKPESAARYLHRIRGRLLKFWRTESGTFTSEEISKAEKDHGKTLEKVIDEAIKEFRRVA